MLGLNFLIYKYFKETHMISFNQVRSVLKYFFPSIPSLTVSSQISTFDPGIEHFDCSLD